MAIKYKIDVEKDKTQAKATYNVEAPIGNTELIASFQLMVAGTNLVADFKPGQKKFFGTRYHTLAKPSEDATVSFSIADNNNWSRDGSDTLRGDKTLDDVHFSG